MKNSPFLVFIICLMGFFQGLGQNIFDSNLVVVEKKNGTVGFYKASGERYAEVRVGEHPHEIILSKNGRYAYTTDCGVMGWKDEGLGDNTVSVIDLKTKKLIKSINLGDYRRPHGIDIDYETGTIAVTVELPSGMITIDSYRNELIRFYDSKGKSTHNVALTHGAEYAYVCNIPDSTISKINLKTGAVQVAIVGDLPQGVALTKDEKQLYVSCKGFHAIVDTETLEVIGKVGSGGSRVALSSDGKYMLGTGPKKIEFINVESKEVEYETLMPTGMGSMEISKDGNWIFTSGGGSLYIISAKTKELVSTIIAPKGMVPDPFYGIKY